MSTFSIVLVRKLFLAGKSNQSMGGRCRNTHILSTYSPQHLPRAQYVGMNLIVNLSKFRQHYGIVMRMLYSAYFHAALIWICKPHDTFSLLQSNTTINSCDETSHVDLPWSSMAFHSHIVLVTTATPELWKWEAKLFNISSKLLYHLIFVTGTSMWSLFSLEDLYVSGTRKGL